MKKVLLHFICVFLATQVNSQGPIPNGGFENWNSTTYEGLPGYFTSNEENIGKGLPLNVIKVTDFYHGAFAAKLTTVSNASDTAFGVIANGDPTNPAGQGRPYNEKPTGIRLYYKSALMPGDSAIVWTLFKAGGNIIGSYLYKIGGTQSTYTLCAKTFSPALPVTPDTIIFAAVSSDALVSSGIPGSMIQLDSINFTGVINQPANFNGDFEVWQNQSISDLISWYESDRGTAQTNDANTGNYALQLGTTMDGGTAHVGNATTGTSVQGGTIGGHPYSVQKDTLVFYYKYNRADVNDSAAVSMEFKKTGNSFSNIKKLLVPAGTYTYVEVPFNLSQAPDTVIIYITSSKNWNVPPSYAGSDIKIDDMKFKSQTPPTGISHPAGDHPQGGFFSRQEKISIYPNPCKDGFSINLKGLDSPVERITLFDITGMRLESRMYDGGNTSLSDYFTLNNLSTGIYFIQVYTNEKLYTKKVNKLD